MMPASVQGWGCSCTVLSPTAVIIESPAGAPGSTTTWLRALGPEPATGTTGCRDISNLAKGGQFSQARGGNGTSSYTESTKNGTWNEFLALSGNPPKASG